jgi:hypothetical protein
MISATKDMKDKMITKRRLEILIAGVLLVLVFGVLVLSAVPPVSRDALTHHLAVPKLWLKSGNMSEIPTVEFSYYPMNLDLLYFIPLYFGNDIIPKYIHFTFALLTAWLIFVFLKDRTAKTHYGLLGALVSVIAGDSQAVDHGICRFRAGLFFDGRVAVCLEMGSQRKSNPTFVDCRLILRPGTWHQI